jgi:hypothetical protein
MSSARFCCSCLSKTCPTLKPLPCSPFRSGPSCLDCRGARATVAAHGRRTGTVGGIEDHPEVGEMSSGRPIAEDDLHAYVDGALTPSRRVES